jgi:hypothetical protein
MRAAILHQMDIARFAAIEGEELAQSLNPYRAAFDQVSCQKNGLPETAQEATCQSAGPNMGKIFLSSCQICPP